MSDGSASSHDDELPPDPWAGLAGPPPPPTWRPPDEPAARPPGWRSHPSVTGDGQPSRRSPRPSVWHHPAIWFALLGLAALLLVTALLEPRDRPPSGGDPDAVTAAAATTE